MILLTGSPDRSKTVFLEDQRRFRSGAFQVDDETGLMIYVPGFRDLLGGWTCPCSTSSVRRTGTWIWRKTCALYTETIG